MWLDPGESSGVYGWTLVSHQGCMAGPWWVIRCVWLDPGESAAYPTSLFLSHLSTLPLYDAPPPSPPPPTR